MKIGETINPASNKTSAHQFDDFLLKPLSKGRRGDQLIRINISRNTLIAIIFSLLIHVLFLFSVVPHIQFDNASAPQPQAIEVSLAPPKPPKVIEPKVVEVPQEITQEKPQVKPQVKPIPKQIKPSPKVIAQKPNANVKPAFTVPDVVTTPKPAPPQDNVADMASYVKMQQAKRQASETDAAKQNAEAVAREIGPSEDEKRNERIKANFKRGSNGLFNISSLTSRHATFSFKGWTNDYSNAQLQFFEVEATGNQNIQLLIVKRMISLIREHYQGDFNWESHRLDRVIVQSARLEDNAGLEEFLMKELF